MADQGEQYERSWILYNILDRMIGSRELVDTRRRLTVGIEKILDPIWWTSSHFRTGSRAEGMELAWSDFDVMFIDTDVIVVCPDQDTSFPPDSTDKTVLMMREADSRPGYVTLEVVHLGQRSTPHLQKALVPVDDVHFISSEIYSRSHADSVSDEYKLNMETNGPAFCLKDDHSNIAHDVDFVHSVPCMSWAREANEWASRPRLHGWPDEALRNEIERGGCHLVPVGDKTSADTFLQWRISFTTAERKLIHSLTHLQFLVYGLLKFFLKQISDRLKQILGDTDILSSYIIKTVIFHAVENTPESFWQEKDIFLCFLFCLKKIIAWVKAGYCPNYFINRNNMFLGKVHGENQQKLFRFLTDLHDMKWECLSFGTFLQPSIGMILHHIRNGSMRITLSLPTDSERECDLAIFTRAITNGNYNRYILPVSLAILCESKSDLDECIAYIGTAQAMSCTGMESLGEHTDARGNKEKYRSLRKCKKLITPLASVCTGLLTLATYHYQTGNYMKTLEMCGNMISSVKIYHGYGALFEDKKRYARLFCGRGYTLLHKFQQAFVSCVCIPKHASQYCPSQLHHELTKLNEIDRLTIPPLPYAVFLSFLCHHELNDIKRRDAALIHLQSVKSDEEQGGDYHWIVHNLLRVCFEIVGDKGRAFREYRDSLGGRINQHANPAMERIARLQHS